MAGSDSVLAHQVYGLVEKSIYDALVLDYSVTKITNEQLFAPQGIFGDNTENFSYRDGSGAAPSVSKLEVQRNGDWIAPVEILVTFVD